MRLNETKLREAQRIASIGNWELDLLTNRVICSEEAAQLFAKPRQSIANFDDLVRMIHPEERQAFQQAYHHSVNTQKAFEQIHRIVSADGQTKFVNHFCTTLYAPNGMALRSLGLLQDITAIKQVEQQLRLAKETAEAANKELFKAKQSAEGANRAKSTFIGRMSHELRTPLNAILGFTQVITGDRTVSAKHKENLEAINSSGENLLRLINDVLEMSRIEAGLARLNPVGFDLHRLLDGLEGMFRLRAEEKDLQLVCHKDPSLSQHVCTDEAKLLKVLINLLDNAIKFTEKGGVTLRGAYRTEGHRLFFEVEDSGPGIAPEDAENLFAPFVQPDVGNLAQEGLGLGLPISQQYVRLMDGEITVSSQVGQGATFKFDVQIETTGQENTIQPASTDSESEMLRPEALSGLPADWLSGLLQAASVADTEAALKLLQQIEAEHADLARALTVLTHNFQFHRIVELAQAAEGTGGPVEGRTAKRN